MGGRTELADRAFHFQLDQPFELDRILHRKLANEVVNESIHAQAHGLRFTEAALLHVKDLLRGNLRHASFMLNGIARAADGDGGIGVSARGGINEKRVALGIVFAILEMFRHVNQSTISSSAGAETSQELQKQYRVRRASD